MPDKHHRTLNVFKSYSFRDKDPIIDQVRTVVQDSGAKFSTIEADSGVSVSTLHGWFSGPVKRPQFATVMAVVRSLGYDMVLTERTAANGAATRSAQIIDLRGRVSTRTLNAAGRAAHA